MSRNLKQHLEAGKLLVGGMITDFLRPAMLKLYAQFGFDFAYIENEHAMRNPETLVDAITAAADNGLATMKVPCCSMGRWRRFKARPESCWKSKPDFGKSSLPPMASIDIRR